MDPFIVLGSAVVGLLVGLTGAGGGALMTPMLVMLFSVKPTAAISSDLVAALVMRPVGAVVHFKRGTVNLRLVAWMAAGSVPAAFAGAYSLHELGTRDAKAVEVALGAALVLGAGGMAFRWVMDRRSGHERLALASSINAKPLPTLAIGALGGFVVGLSSVGSGSLMIVLLMFVYPNLAAKQLVGTDLAQAIPLTAAAALGAVAFGHVELPVTASVVAGSVPAVLVGSLMSSKVRDGLVRPVIGLVIFASGLKYLGASTGEVVLGALVALLAVAFAFGVAFAQNHRKKVLIHGAGGHINS